MSYNLITEPWIPVEYLDGHREKIGLKVAFKDAHLIRDIVEQKPTYEFGMYMLLFIISMDAFRPTCKGDIKNLLHSKEFDIDTVNDYLHQICGESRFDLFDSKYPFMQWFNKAELTKKDIACISNISVDLPHGTNILHNDRSKTEKTISMTYDEVAKALCAWYICSPGVGAGNASAMFNSAIMSIVSGNNLFETICYNIVFDEKVLGNIDKLLPPWRATNNFISNTDYSLFNYMYLPNKKIILIDNGDGTIRQMYFKGNDRLLNVKKDIDIMISNPSVFNPYLTYTSKKDTDIYYPVQIKMFGNNAKWYDFIAIYPTFANEAARPKIITQFQKNNNPESIDVISFYASYKNADCLDMGRVNYTISKEVFETNYSAFIEAYTIVNNISNNIKKIEKSMVKSCFATKFKLDNDRPHIKYFESYCRDAFYREFLPTLDLDMWRKTVIKIACERLSDFYHNYPDIMDFKKYILAKDSIFGFKKIQKNTGDITIMETNVTPIYSINEKVKRFTTGEVAAFKHALGTTYKDSEWRVKELFLKYFGNVPNYDIEKVFLSICAYCQNTNLNKIATLDSAIKSYKIANRYDNKSSFVKKIDNLLNISWKYDEYTANKEFSNIIRQVTSSHYYIDADSLMKDLKYWDISDRVKEAWVRNIYGTIDNNQ